jgi:hypothetical protein
MWYLIQWITPEHALEVWVLVVPFILWTGFYVWCFGTNNDHIPILYIRHVLGIFIWTDVLNMFAVEVFNQTPTFWWAHGWTMAFIPVLNWWRFMIPIYGATLMLFGPSLVFLSGVGFSI